MMTQHPDLDALQAACKSDSAFEMNFTPEVCEALIDRLRKAEAASKWISVKDRLPEPDVPVLVNNGKWTGVGAWVSGDYIEPIERWQDERREFIGLFGPAVTHWQPLPAAPDSTPTDSADSEGAKG